MKTYFRLYTLSLLLCVCEIIHSQHNYEFYNNGALVYTSTGSDIYVMGDVHTVNSSDFQHNGFMEVEGNMYAGNVMRQSGTGTVRLHNRLVNTGQAQTIYGANGYAVRGGYAQIGTANDGSFYNLELANDLGTVYLSGGGYVADVRNSVNFSPLGGTINRIITSDPPPTAIPANGSSYPSIFGIMNRNTTLTTRMPNNTVSTNGNSSAIDNGYVQGKLRQAIDPVGGIYGFVLGLEPMAGATQRGMQYVHLNLNANTYDVITGYFQTGSTNVVAGSPIECSGYFINYFGGSDHGEWVFSQIGGNTGSYEAKVWPQNDNFPALSLWVLTLNDALSGTANDCGPTAVGLDRAGFVGGGEIGVAASTIYVLPIELIDLSATPINDHTIKVQWVTASENNVNHFEVERSEDGINTTYIGSVASAGNNSSANQNYILDDVNCDKNKIYYYRIKIIENDNTFHYTNFVSAIINDNTFVNGILSTYPNPLKNNELTISYISASQKQATIGVFNTIGQEIYKSDWNITTGQNNSFVQFDHLASGIYFVTVTDNTGEILGKIKVIKE